ncbi:MAG: hypothetical protein ACLQUW_14280 [Desulfobaccales bacterium]
MNYLDYFILGAILVGTVVLAAPISFEFDSTERRVKFVWLGLNITRRLQGQRREKAPKKTKKRWKTRGLAMLRRLCQGRDLVWELVERVRRFGLEVFRGLFFHNSEVRISLPDPMWNGLLYAAVGNLQLKEMNLSVNFDNCNYAKVWVTAYPYRVIWRLATLLLTLPYIRLLRLARDLKRNRQPI